MGFDNIAPLKYRPSAVLYHRGSRNDNDHWVALVRGPEREYKVDD